MSGQRPCHLLAFRGCLPWEHRSPPPIPRGCSACSRPEDGGEVLEIGLSTGNASKFKYGDMVQVLYNPKQPRHVVLPGENLWVGLIILGTIGLVVLCAPFLVGL
ncbi:DUF3592 domain-containing protein [Corallococcus exiguus]|uniref:DUF3592 domain-containing protein n=1 Tax=Corallococcus sp. AB032C TaxID=2316717 RepID=UPI0032119540